MNKKTLFAALSAVVLVSASYIGYRQVSNSSADDLFMANVEALSDSEFTNTSWYCEETGICSAMCGKCGTSVHGTGTLKGSHQCSSQN